MKYLVTGGVGFIGSNMVDFLLKKGHKVVVVDNFSGYYDIALKRHNQQLIEANGGDVIEADLADLANFESFDEDFDFIIHLAAQPGIQPNSSFESYVKNNIIATKNLLTYALQLSSLNMFINIGTSSIYGSNATCTEEEIPRPTSYYGVTKLAAEQLVLSEARKNKLKACSLRLYSVYGPRERPDKLLPKLIDSAIHDRKFPLHEGSEKHLRSFTYVGDVVNGIYQASKRHKFLNKEIINLGNSEQRTTKDAIITVENLLKKHISLKMTPPREGDQLSTKAIIKKAKFLFNYKAETSLEKGIEQQIEWYKKTQL